MPIWFKGPKDGRDATSPWLPLAAYAYDGLNAYDYGVVGDGVANDTAALTSYAAACLAASKAFVIPVHLNCRITSQLNLRNIRHVDIQGTITVDYSGTPAIIVGISSLVATESSIRIAQVVNGAGAGTDPSVRVMGVKNGEVWIGLAPYVQLYADAAVTSDASIAYSDFFFGKIDKLQLNGVNGSAFINENNFWGGRYLDISFVGTYSHNNNKFHHICLEGSGAKMRLSVGSANEFSLRGEGGSTVTFASGTFGNVVDDHHVSNAATRAPSMTVTGDSGTAQAGGATTITLRSGASAVNDHYNECLVKIISGTGAGQIRTITGYVGSTKVATVSTWTTNPDATSVYVVVGDVGLGNILRSLSDQHQTAVEVIRLDNNTRLFTASREWAGVGADYLTPGLRKLAITTASRTYIDTGIVPIENIGVAGNYQDNARIDWFDFLSDLTGWRYRVEGYDKDRVVVDPAVTAFMETTGGWVVSGTGYSFGANVAFGPVRIKNDDIKYLRLLAASGNATAGSLFNFVSITAYVPDGTPDMLVEAFKRSLYRPLYATAVPTTGVGHPGERIGNATGSYTIIDRRDTTLAVAAVATNLTITVASATGMASGDLIGVELDTGGTHWTTINGAPAGAVVTLTVAMPSGAAIGRAVVTNRWV